MTVTKRAEFWHSEAAYLLERGELEQAIRVSLRAARAEREDLAATVLARDVFSLLAEV